MVKPDTIDKAFPPPAATVAASAGAVITTGGKTAGAVKYSEGNEIHEFDAWYVPRCKSVREERTGIRVSTTDCCCRDGALHILIREDLNGPKYASRIVKL